MVIPDRPMVPPQQQIATYDFFDLAQQVGYVSFYGAAIDTSAGLAFRFFREQNNTFGTNTTGAGTTASYNAYYSQVSSGYTGEYNYDFTVTRPMIIEGDIFLSYQIVNETNAAAGSDGHALTTIKVYHYDGSTETQLGSTVSHDDQNGAGTTYAWAHSDVVTAARTLFKVGETFRVEITLQCNGAHASSNSRFLHEPNNSSAMTVTAGYYAGSQFKVNVPVYLGT